MSENDSNLIWINEEENKRIIIDKVYNTAIVTENADDAIKAGSLNSTYIDNYFENDNMNFKYLGEEDGFYKVQFTESSSEIEIVLYINIETGIVEKLIENYNGNAITTVEFDVTLDCITEEEIEEPDLTEYNVGTSSSSGIDTTTSSDESDENTGEENGDTENSDVDENNNVEE